MLGDPLPGFGGGQTMEVGASSDLRYRRVLTPQRVAVPPARPFSSETTLGLEELAREQAALRRVATDVAEAAPADELFAAVAEELGSVVLEADVALVGRYESGDALKVVGGWRRDGDPVFLG